MLWFNDVWEKLAHVLCAGWIKGIEGDNAGNDQYVMLERQQVNNSV